MALIWQISRGEMIQTGKSCKTEHLSSLVLAINKNTKIKIALSVDKGCILIKILVTCLHLQKTILVCSTINKYGFWKRLSSSRTYHPNGSRLIIFKTADGVYKIKIWYQFFRSGETIYVAWEFILLVLTGWLTSFGSSQTFNNAWFSMIKIISTGFRIKYQTKISNKCDASKLYKFAFLVSVNLK